jgi:hypothetical protein
MNSLFRALARSALLLSSLAIPACGSSGSETPSPANPAPPGASDGGTGTAPEGGPGVPPDAGPDSGTSACALGVSVSRTDFLAASTKLLRDTFGTTTGFDGGAVAYGEMKVSLDDVCPYADWTALAYVVAIDPSFVPTELRTTHKHVAAVWSLNGLRTIAWVPSIEITAADPAPWQKGALPDNVNAIKKDNASGAAANALVQQIMTAHPTVKVDWLDAIGILTLSSTISDFAADPAIPKGSFKEIDAAAAKVRQSNLFSVLEWSGLNFRIPNESWPAALVTSATLEPECLRKETKNDRAQNLFTTLPALAAPLGKGPVPNPNTCK